MWNPGSSNWDNLKTITGKSSLYLGLDYTGGSLSIPKTDRFVDNMLTVYKFRWSIVAGMSTDRNSFELAAPGGNSPIGLAPESSQQLLLERSSHRGGAAAESNFVAALLANGSAQLSDLEQATAQPTPSPGLPLSADALRSPQWSGAALAASVALSGAGSIGKPGAADLESLDPIISDAVFAQGFNL